MAKAAKAAPVAWPADKIERRTLASLIPYVRNARTHTPTQVAQIVGSIKQFGWTMPILIDEDNTIIAGHGRVLAAEQMGIPEVPVMVATGWSSAQKAAYCLADNRIPLNASWDDDLLRNEIADLRDQGVDLASLGFSASDLKKLSGAAEEKLDSASELGDHLQFQVIVNCADEQDQADLMSQLEKDGRECRPLTL